MCSDEDPAKVLVLLHWETREHHERWRGTPPHVKFRQTIDPWQTKPSLGGLLRRRDHLTRWDIPLDCSGLVQVSALGPRVRHEPSEGALLPGVASPGKLQRAGVL